MHCKHTKERATHFEESSPVIEDKVDPRQLLPSLQQNPRPSPQPDPVLRILEAIDVRALTQILFCFQITPDVSDLQLDDGVVRS